MNPLLAEYLIGSDYSLTIGWYRFGFMDADHDCHQVTLLHAGPFGGYIEVPVSAVQGWAIAALLFASLLIVLACLLSRRTKRKLKAE